MSATIREQIIAAYVTRLESWTTANGYNHNCGAKVQRAVQHVEFKDLPVCVLFPQSEAVEQRYNQNLCEMTIKIEAIATLGTGNASEIQEELLGDIIRIMTDQTVSVTALIEDIVYTNGGGAELINPEEQTVGAVAEFKIKYFTIIGDPYSQ